MSLYPEIGTTDLDGFEVWDRTVGAPAGQGRAVAYVSVRVGGNVGLNKAAVKMLGPCDAVKVMYDSKRHRLGFVVADPETANSFEIASHSGVQLTCGKLFEYYGVEIEETRRYHDLQMVDGVLIANLGGESERAPKGGGRRGPRW